MGRAQTGDTKFDSKAWIKHEGRKIKPEKLDMMKK